MVNIVTDLLTYSLPIPLVSKLQMPLQQRIGLAVILSLGLLYVCSVPSTSHRHRHSLSKQISPGTTQHTSKFLADSCSPVRPPSACISSIIRISYIPQMLASTDPTWTIAGAMYWSVIETNIGILAASIPSWKVLAKRYVPRLLGSSNKSSGKGRQGSSGYQLSSVGGKGSRSAHKGLRVDLGGSRSGGVKSDNSSDEEVLFTPTGRIGVKTEIHMSFDECSS